MKQYKQYDELDNRGDDVETDMEETDVEETKETTTVKKRLSNCKEVPIYRSPNYGRGRLSHFHSLQHRRKHKPVPTKPNFTETPFSDDELANHGYDGEETESNEEEETTAKKKLPSCGKAAVNTRKTSIQYMQEPSFDFGNETPETDSMEEEVELQPNKSIVLKRVPGAKIITTQNPFDIGNKTQKTNRPSAPQHRKTQQRANSSISSDKPIVTQKKNPGTLIGGLASEKNRKTFRQRFPSKSSKIPRRRDIKVFKSQHVELSSYKNLPLRTVCIDKCATNTKIDSTTFQVLTHLHNDHLPASICGFAYCSKSTYNLATESQMNLSLRSAPTQKKLVFPEQWGAFPDKYKPVTFWLFNSWHCEGSVMVLYTHGLLDSDKNQDNNKVFYLNTGDFRYDNWSQYGETGPTITQIHSILSSSINGALKLVIYYDDTFIDKHSKPDTFPSREESVKKIQKVIDQNQEKTVVVDWLNSGLKNTLKNVEFEARGQPLMNKKFIHPSALSRSVKDMLFYSDHGSKTELQQFVSDIKKGAQFEVELIKLSATKTTTDLNGSDSFSSVSIGSLDSE